MVDELMIVTIEGEGARLYPISQIKIRWELPDFEGARVVVMDVDEPIDGQICFVDLERLLGYSEETLTNVRTGELDIIGMTRSIEQAKRDIAERQRQKEAKEFHEELKKLKAGLL